MVNKKEAVGNIVTSLGVYSENVRKEKFRKSSPLMCKWHDKNLWI